MGGIDCSGPRGHAVPRLTHICICIVVIIYLVHESIRLSLYEYNRELKISERTGLSTTLGLSGKYLTTSLGADQLG